MYRLTLSLFVLFLACNTKGAYDVETGESPKSEYRVGSADTSLTLIIQGGLIESESMEAYKIIGSKYGISFLIAGGCVLTTSLDKRMKNHNTPVYNILEKKYGPQMQLRIKREFSLVIDSILFKKKLKN